MVDRERADHHIKRLGKAIRDCGLVESYESAGAYAETPLSWAPTPESAWCGIFDGAEIATALEGMLAQQAPDGAWPLNVPNTSAASEFEWKAHLAIRNLLTLRSYGHL